MGIRQYKANIQKEAKHWDDFERKSLERGIPWWVDLRRAKMDGSNLFWIEDPRKEEIIRGEEKRRLIELALHKKGKILDLGCGAGWLSLELARNGAEVTGIDISPIRIQVAKKFLEENPYREGFGSVEYKVCDLNKVVLSEEEFDVVVVWDALHHILELERLLREVRKSLKPGGEMIIFDHIGNKFLKLGGRVLRIFSKEATQAEIAPFEDIIGKKMILLIKKNFSVKFVKTRLSLPVAILLYFLFSRDNLFSFLPLIVKIDKFLCNSRLFYGEYFFIHAVKE